MPPDINASDKIGLIAGGGNLPAEIIRSCKVLNRQLFVIYLKDNDPAPQCLQDVPHINLGIGSVGKAIKTFREQNIKHIVMAGWIKRPRLLNLKPDAGGVKLLAKISAAKLSGDNSLLVTVIKFFEDSGFRIVGVEQILQELLIKEGRLGKIEPNKTAINDIHYGVDIAKTIGNLDIGQAVVVQGGTVLGVEALEGTDALIARCASLKLEGPGGVLVKMKKPIQDNRVDLPTIGVDTVINAHNAGLRGIAIEAGGALVVDKEKVVATADKLGLFVVGVASNGEF